MVAQERSADHVAVARHFQALADLGRVHVALANAHVPFLVVKGPALVSTLYDGISTARSYVDLDVLVHPSDLGRALRALEPGDITVIDANWPMLMNAGVNELRLLGPTGGAIDLHWRLTGRASGMPSPSTQHLMERSQTVVIDGMACQTLGPADTVVHLAVHAAGSGGDRLIWLQDLEGALSRAAVMCAPGDLTATADEWEARPALDLMLRRLRLTCGVERPAELEGLIKPGLWVALVWLADRLSPPTRSRKSGSLSRLVARSCRPTSRQSLAAFASKSCRWLLGRGKRPLTVAELLDPTNPASALYPVGGREGAEAFFAMVAASDQDSSSTSAAAPSDGVV